MLFFGLGCDVIFLCWGWDVFDVIFGCLVGGVGCGVVLGLGMVVVVVVVVLG